MKNVVVAVKIAPVRARFSPVAGKRTAVAPPSPHIGMRGIPIRERPLLYAFALGPHTFFRHAHQRRLPARSLSYCHDDTMLRNGWCFFGNVALSPAPFTKGGTMGLFLAFCQNMGNLKRKGGQQRIPQKTLIADWNRALSSDEAIDLSFVDYYRHTGNYLLRTSGDYSAHEITQNLATHIPSHAFAVFEHDQFARIQVEVCQAFNNPPFMTERRLTRGLVMDLDPKGGAPSAPSSNTKFEIGSFAVPRIRTGWKKDILNSGGQTLDRTRREGGWGELATYFRTRCGGSWTARSMGTVEGLLKKACDHEARNF